MSAIRKIPDDSLVSDLEISMMEWRRREKTSSDTQETLDSMDATLNYRSSSKNINE